MLSINIDNPTFKFNTVSKNNPSDVAMETENVSKVIMANGKTYYVRDLYTVNGQEDFVYLTDIFYGKICLSRRYIVSVQQVKIVEIKENDLENINRYKKEFKKYIIYSFYEIPKDVKAELDLSISNTAEDNNGNQIKPIATILDKKHV